MRINEFIENKCIYSLVPKRVLERLCGNEIAIFSYQRGEKTGLSCFRAISGIGIGIGLDLCAGLFYEHRFAMLIR